MSLNRSLSKYVLYPLLFNISEQPLIQLKCVEKTVIFRIFTFITVFISLPVPQSIALFQKITIQEDRCQILIIRERGGGGGGEEVKDETTKSVVSGWTFILKLCLKNER